MVFNLKKALRYCLLVLIASTVAFAFFQSTLSPAQSGATSDAVGEIIEEIIPPETPVGNYVQINLRKIAHFVEFACLGIEVALYVFIYHRRLSFALLSYLFAMTVALFDETIQIFSGRGASVSDVWLDFSGFVFSSLLTYLLALAGCFITAKIKNRKKS